MVDSRSNEEPSVNANERTSLLPPIHGGSDTTSSGTRPRRLSISASSSSLPLASSYEDLQGSAEIQLKAIDQSARKKLVDPSSNLLTGGNNIDRRPAFLMLLLGCILSVAVISYPSLHRNYRNEDVGDLPKDLHTHPKPLSRHHPVTDLGLMAVERPVETGPPKQLFRHHPARQNGRRDALPTNAWYQNILLLDDGQEPTNVHRAYASPYIFDVVGSVPGLRLSPNRIDSGNMVMQLALNDQHGMTLGALPKKLKRNNKSPSLPHGLSHRYSVLATTELGVTLGWDDYQMESSIVRGMPYATMTYRNDNKNVIIPTLSSMISVSKVWVDGKHSDLCSSSLETEESSSSKDVAWVQSDMELYFEDSDFSWMVFVSEPVQVQCVVVDGGTLLQVVNRTTSTSGLEQNNPLILRLTSLSQCTTGSNPTACEKGLGHYLSSTPSIDVVRHLLRKHADFYPGNETSVKFVVNDDVSEAEIMFDWDVQTMSSLHDNGLKERDQDEDMEDKKKSELRGSSEHSNSIRKDGLIMFALSHHLDMLDSSVLPEGTLYCKSSLVGPTCLVAGSTWNMIEDLPELSFRAPRAPGPEYIPAITKALEKDMKFHLPRFFRIGAGDTYFSGKMIAKLSRILLIYEEVKELCHGHGTVDYYASVCSNVTLPSKQQFNEAVDRLRANVEVWINGTAVTPFVFDPAWGGMVSCGCDFTEDDTCSNRAPDCPAFFDQGLNFGNAFYNDQHFHYGYHIYAAATLAHFDNEWGKKHFEQVLLLVRSIANPSRQDTSFPLYRHKDFYQGMSWASGVPRPPYLNGKNQESSSEAIASYEAVGLFGHTMYSIWKEDGNEVLASVSEAIRKIGALLTKTEIRSTQRYYHVHQNDEKKRIYPEIYKQNVIGILWSTMAQFGTWFGASPYLPIGIQLIPLTPISEHRDDLAWANEVYYPFSKSCSEDFKCTRSGWVILQLGILATVGHIDVAAGRVEGLPDEAYENAGGNGQSKSNTLWYISTRRSVANPVALDDSDLRGSDEKRPAPVYKLTDCHVPAECTSEVLDSKAGDYTCRERITYLIDYMGESQWEACADVGGLEYPSVCGPCNPNKSYEAEKAHEKDLDTTNCPACSQQECDSELNRCPVFDRIFVCSGGASYGGCSDEPWNIDSFQCRKCCEMTNCQSKHDLEAEKLTKDNQSPKLCPPCEKDICYSKINQCPLHSAPYLCTKGKSIGGCSREPWEVETEGSCSECCEVTTDC